MSDFSKNSVKCTTVETWSKSLDAKGEWLSFTKNASDTNVVNSVFCKLCRKYEDRIRCLRNYNNSFLDGPPLKDFSASSPVDRFLSTPRKENVGHSKRAANDITEERNYVPKLTKLV